MNESARYFIYVDDDRVASIYSQLFEGFTAFHDSTLASSTMTSGRNSSEGTPRNEPPNHERMERMIRKLLLDHAYLEMEEKLINSERTLRISPTVAGDIDKTDTYSFISVTGNLRLIDSEIIIDFIENYNSIGRALTYVTTQSLHEDESAVRAVKPDKKTLDSKINRAQRKQELYKDPEYLTCLAQLLRRWNADSLVAEIWPNNNDVDHEFHAVLNRGFLRDKDASIARKLSRYSQHEYTVFGIITRTNTHNDLGPSRAGHGDSDGDKAVATIKESTRNLAMNAFRMELPFIQDNSKTITIDPLAIYRTL